MARALRRNSERQVEAPGDFERALDVQSLITRGAVNYNEIRFPRRGRYRDGLLLRGTRQPGHVQVRARAVTGTLPSVDLTHGMADVEPGLRLHYVTAGEGERTIVLLHGFPQTWWEWHKVIPELVGGGLRVIAPDLPRRRPLVAAGRRLRQGAHWRATCSGCVREHLGVDGPVVVVATTSG